MSTTGTDELDQQDMAQLVEGEDAALNRLMQRHGERLLHFLIRLAQDPAAAADLTQETFVRVYLNRHKFNPHLKFGAWLYTIATNLARDRGRWLSRHPQVSLENTADSTAHEYKAVLPDPRPNPSEQLQSAERAEAVRGAVAELPEDLRLPLLLAEYEERPQAEIAVILGCSVKAVEMRLYRARQHLRRRLEHLMG